MLLAGHLDTVPAQGNRPGPPRRRRRPRPRRRRHEGRAGGHGRAGARAAEGHGRPRLRASSGARSCRHRERADAAARARARAARRRPRRHDGADRQRAARRLPGQRQRDVDVPRALRATPRARGWPTTRSTARPRGSPRSPQVPPDAARVRRAALHRGRLGDADRRRHRAQRHPRRGGRRASTTATRRAAAPARPRRGCARCASRTASWRSTATRRAPRWRRPTRWRSASSPPATSRSRPSRRGRRSPSSPRPASTPSTSGPATRRRRTPATSTSRVDALVRSLRDARGVRVRLNPVLAGMRTYPFVRLTEAKRRRPRRAASRSSTSASASRARRRPAFIRRALVGALDAEPMSTYPLAEGLPELRAAIAAWIARRFGAALDPDTRGRPHARLQGGDLPPRAGRGGPGDRVAVTTPGYPVPARGALFAGARGRRARRSTPRAAGCPTSTPSTGTASRCCGSTSRTTRPPRPRRRRSTSGPPRWRASTASSLASDEAYCELCFEGEPPRRRSQVADRTNVLALNTLSKRSSMPGYRSGFVAGDPSSSPRSSATARTSASRRRSSSSARRSPRGATRTHVAEVRERYRAKRDVLLPALLAAAACEPAGGRRLVLPVAARAGRRGRRGLRAAAARARGIVGRPRLVLRPGRRGLRARRAGADARRTAGARPTAPSVRAHERGTTDLMRPRRRDRGPLRAPDRRPDATEAAATVEEALALLDDGSVRVAAPDATPGWHVNEWAKKAILLSFRTRGDAHDRARALRVPRQDAAEGRLGRARRTCRAAGDRPPGRLRRAGRRAHALLRQRRRVGRLGHDGRHVGDRRLVRADRRRRAPLGRRRHRRRARAAAGRRR